MAEQATIDHLRLLVGEKVRPGMTEDDTFFRDADLNALLDANSLDLTVSAAEAWVMKAAEFAALIDRTESGTAIDLSQKFKHALAMAEHFASLAQVDVVALQASYRAVGKAMNLDDTKKASESLQTPFSGYTEHVRTYLLKRFPSVMSGKPYG